jgi:type I protein arginine methyltransferase
MVYAIEPSKTNELATKLIEENGLSDRIKVIKKKVEELIVLEDLPQVDIIISEWMGYCLLYEGMLPSVLYARDHFLVKGGLIFPDRAKIFVAGVNDQAYKFYNDLFYQKEHNPYGVSLQALVKQRRNFVEVQTLKPEQVISTGCKVFDVDLNSCTVDDLQFSSEYSLMILPRDQNGGVTTQRQDFNGLVMWFETDFPIANNMREDQKIVLSSSPLQPLTHWKHQLLYFQEPEHQMLSVPVGERVSGSLALRRNPEDIHDIEIKASVAFSERRIVGQYIFT